MTRKKPISSRRLKISRLSSTKKSIVDIKDWRKTEDFRGRFNVRPDSSFVVIAWGKTYNDESVWVEYSKNRKKYIPIYDDETGAKELGLYNTQSEAIKKAEKFMSSPKSKSELSNTKDSDGDGVVDSKDCEPFNPKKQGFLHELALKRLKRQEEKLETTREKELKKLEDVKDVLHEKQAIAFRKVNIKQLKLKQKQVIIDEITREKNKLQELKDANRRAKNQLDKLTVTGRIKAQLRKDSFLALEGTKAFIKKKSTQKVLKDIRKSIIGV